MVTLKRKAIGTRFKYKPFINNHNWEGIKYLSGKDDLGKYEQKMDNVLYEQKMKKCPAYTSKYNFTRKK